MRRRNIAREDLRQLGLEPRPEGMITVKNRHPKRVATQHAVPVDKYNFSPERHLELFHLPPLI
jgi:hypothetical protein